MRRLIFKIPFGSSLVNFTFALAALFLAGCGGPALKTSFNDYTAAYADVSNRQMLLNLARLSNRHPSYFLQMGGISATFQFAASAGAQAGASRGESFAGTTVIPVLDAMTYGLNASGNRSEQPSFNFTPLAGGTFAQAVLVPISPNVLYTLYEQGYRVDQLFRTIVQSIEFDNPTTGKRQTFENTPDEANPKNYSDFLTLCGVARELQTRGLLHVQTIPSMSPVPSPVFEHPSVDDTLKAGAQGFVLQEKEPGKYTLAHTSSITTFKLDPLAQEVMSDLAKDEAFRLETAGKVSSSDSPGGGMVITLRPFISVLYATANEAHVFDKLVAENPTFLNHLPPTQREPILRIDWTQIPGERVPSLVELDYSGKHYAITDLKDSSDNRDVFVLLNYLFSQVALDPSKLPVQQLIQVK
jgi:hypothetical protein